MFVPTNKPNSALEELSEQAIALLLQTEHMDAVSAQEQIALWESRSHAHQLAMREAQALVQSLGRLTAPKLSRRERLLLACQTFVASALDFPGRALLNVGSVVLLILGVSLLLQNYVLHQREAAVGARTADLAPPVLALETNTAIRTRRGDVEHHLLADGSELWLDWNSRVEIAYSAKERRILLSKGRARFAVAKDASRPFRVLAAGVEAQALGTEFVVSKLDFESVEISVREGIVGVGLGGASEGLAVKPLEAEEVLLVDGDAPAQRGRRSVDEIGSWVDEVLLFDQRGLGEVLKALQPYLGYRIDTAMVIDLDRPVSGTFLTHRAEEALAVLMQTYHLEMRARGRGWVELQSASYSPAR